ncbi:MAG: arsenate reductase ArsC [Ignavibacterium sp.]|nr:arsenate reductase ArsC [Ignavibacterium sp.]
MNKRILILCTGNSCRSQMAEGFLKSFDENLEVYSAGTKPADKVNPRAIQVMREVGVDISNGVPEDVSKYINQSFDYVITVCDNAKETCPVFIGKVGKQLHIGFEDPADATGTEEEILSVFRKVRDEIKKDFYEFYLIELKNKWEH